MTDRQTWSKGPPGLRVPSEGGWRSVDSLSAGTFLVSSEERRADLPWVQDMTVFWELRGCDGFGG